MESIWILFRDISNLFDLGVAWNSHDWSLKIEVWRWVSHILKTWIGWNYYSPVWVHFWNFQTSSSSIVSVDRHDTVIAMSCIMYQRQELSTINHTPSSGHNTLICYAGAGAGAETIMIHYCHWSWYMIHFIY